MKNFNLNDLKQEIPYKHKVESVKGYKAVIVAYIDARDAMDLLDKVVGPAAWSDSYERDEKGVLFCCLSIKVGGEWVTKCDAGVESSYQKEKGEVSDAFKRAAVKWGIGRFLYDLPMLELPKKKGSNGKFYPATTSGKILYSNQEINDYIAEVKAIKAQRAAEAAKNTPPAIPPKEEPKVTAAVKTTVSPVKRVEEMLEVISTEQELEISYRGLNSKLKKNAAIIELFKSKRVILASSLKK